MLLGAVGGAGVGAGLGLAHRKLFPHSMLEAPQQSFEMPTAPQSRGVVPKPKARKPAKTEKLGMYPAMAAGAAGGIPAGYTVASLLMDRARAKQLDRLLKSRGEDLDRTLLQEQGVTAKQAQVDSVLRKFASDIYDALEKRGAGGGDLNALYNEIKKLPMLQKQILGSLAGVSLLGGGVYGARRAMASDTGRARMSKVRSSLAERLHGEGDFSAPMVLKVQQKKPSMIPLQQGASSLDPSQGRDVLEGI
jgi:hypothetical protein